MVLLRRFVVLAALMFWVGGFTFYTSVVVPVGTAVLKSDRRQGFITRRVTTYLNLTAAVALTILGAETLLVRDRSRRRWWGRAVLWLLMAACQVGLFVLHPRLDSFLTDSGGIVSDPESFRPLHRIYLWLHTVQWGMSLVFVGLLVFGWQREDQQGEAAKGK